MTTPRLRMGLVGFAAQEYLVALLRTRSALLKWEVSGIGEADALWVNGESAAMGNDGVVRISGHGSQGEVLLDLEHLERPTAFTTPITDDRLQPAASFDSHSAPSVDQALRGAETALKPLVMQLALAAQIVGRLGELTSETYHVVSSGRLIAVVNVGGSIGIDLGLTLLHLDQSTWKGLPAAAGEIPSGFFTTTYTEVLCLYVGRVDTDLLPRRYRSAKLYFRAIPRVSQRVLTDTHYRILSELAAQPQNFRRLQQAMGLRKDVLANGLAVLYHAGSITTDPARAAVDGALGAVADASGGLRHASRSSQGENDPTNPGEGKRTLPIPLDPH